MPHRLTLVQMNDSHAYLDQHAEVFWEGGRTVYRPAGGYARIATLVGEARAANPGGVLFCDGGDTLHGTFPAVDTRGEAVIPALGALRLTAMTAHWEFAYDHDTLQRRSEALGCPMLAANVYREDTGKCFFDPYHVAEAAGLRVGLIGLASNIVDKTMPPAFSRGLRFTLGNEELPGIIATLRDRERADLVVLISHLGFPQDMKLLSEVPGIDVCLSGHTHHRLYRPARQGDALVIQSGCHGSFLGMLDLEVDGGRVVDYQHRLVEVRADTAQDPAVAALVRDALAPYADRLSGVVGETTMPLDRATMLESTMDNLLLQALQAHTGATLAFSNGWRYGAPILPGPVTLNDLYNMIPMNPAVSTVEITGDELLAMLEDNLERTFAADPYDQMGGYLKRCLGLTAYIKVENPAGLRIQHLAVNGEDVRPGGRYPAVFVTEQGVPARFGTGRTELPERAVEVLRDYVTRNSPVRADLRGTFAAV